ncbi:MAG: hypothetical protein M0D55_00220 [Elusimicrobiota bacterium]|nr:MAG: hypothetical protein M0D55_00220 [Elusimicrobiota bacterium]
MKTPSSLLLLPLLLAARPALAEIKPGERCDTAFLENVAKNYVDGNIADERIVDVSRRLGAETVTRKGFRGGDVKICDVGTWNPLVTQTDRVWKQEDAKAHWYANGAKGNAALILVASDFYASVDALAAEALSAADAAIEAGTALGVAAATDWTAQQKTWLAANGGAPTVARAGKSVTALKKAEWVNGTVTPQSVGAALRKLTDDKGQGRAGGSEVIRFRTAVLALAAGLRMHARASGNVRTRLGADAGRLREFIAAPAKEIPELKTGRAEALDDTKYGVALEALTGKGPVASLEDATARPDAALDYVDLALRNLISLRAAQIEGLVASAKEKLEGKSITQIEVAARAAGSPGSARRTTRWRPTCCGA